MTYSKPEIVKLGSPLNAIQGTKKGMVPNLDSVDPQRTTIGAYEADE